MPPPAVVDRSGFVKLVTRFHYVGRPRRSLCAMLIASRLQFRNSQFRRKDARKRPLLGCWDFSWWHDHVYMIFIYFILYVASFKMLQISSNLRRLLSRRQQWSSDEKCVGPAVPWTSLGPAIDMAKVDQVWQNLSRNTCKCKSFWHHFEI